MSYNNEELMVKKRNGDIVSFDITKIYNAIKLATEASQKDGYHFDENICNEISGKVRSYCIDYCINHDTNVIDIEVIQDTVERILIKSGYADTAKEYILYRQKRTDIRNTRDSIADSIGEILKMDSEESDLKRDNGNIDGDNPMGSMLQIGSNVSKNYYLNNMISKDIVTAYNDGFIHIHDLDFYGLTMTCCQIDCLKLFKGGFNTGHGHIREPNSIMSYTTLAAIALQSNQNDMHR